MYVSISIVQTIKFKRKGYFDYHDKYIPQITEWNQNNLLPPSISLDKLSDAF